MRHLYGRGPDSRGPAVDADGAVLGPDCILVRRTPEGYRCADLDEIRIALAVAYGDDRHASAVFAGDCRIAEALADGEIAFAPIVGLHLPLPDLDAAGLQRAARIASLIKANFNPAQPRVPAGSPEGGQWTGDGQSTDSGGSSGLRTYLIRTGYTLEPEMWRVLRDLYRLSMSSGGNLGALRDYLADRGLRLGELPSAIRSLFDPPRPLKELQTTKPARGFDSEAELRTYLGPAPSGYEWHHLIEQTGQFRPDLTSPAGIRNWIQHTDNMVLVPVIKHYCISGLMSSGFGGSRFRNIVKAHSPEDQREVGFGLLKACGVTP